MTPSELNARTQTVYQDIRDLAPFRFYEIKTDKDADDYLADLLYLQAFLARSISDARGWIASNRSTLKNNETV